MNSSKNNEGGDRVQPRQSPLISPLQLLLIIRSKASNTNTANQSLIIRSRDGRETGSVPPPGACFVLRPGARGRHRATYGSVLRPLAFGSRRPSGMLSDATPPIGGARPCTAGAPCTTATWRASTAGPRKLWSRRTKEGPRPRHATIATITTSSPSPLE